MEPHPTATECHYSYGITQCYLPPDTSKHTALTTARQATGFTMYLPQRDGRLSWPRWPVTLYRWFTRPQMVTHPSNNPVVHGRESNMQPVDHESDALTTTPPSHINVGAINVVRHWRNIFLPILAQHWKCWPTLHILPLYWRNIAFIGQFAPICAILDQYNASIVCYTGGKWKLCFFGSMVFKSWPTFSPYLYNRV